MYVDRDYSYQHIDLRATSSIENKEPEGYVHSFEGRMAPLVCSLDTSYCGLNSNHGTRIILEYLMLNPACELSQDDYESFFDACKGGHASVVSAFLSHPSIDPMMDDNKPLLMAITFGKTKIVEMLLRDYRVDPTRPHNAPLIVAAELGRVDIVKYLLLNVNVDPSYDHCAAVAWAASNGHTEVLDILCDDPRVDVTSWHPRTYDWLSAASECPPSARSRDLGRSLYLKWKEYDSVNVHTAVCTGYNSQCDVFSIELDLDEAHTAIYWALRNSHETAVRFLLNRCGNKLPNLYSIMAFCTDLCMKMVLEEVYKPHNKLRE